MSDKSVFSRLEKFRNQREEDFFTEIFAHALEGDTELLRKVLHKAFGKEFELEDVVISTQETDKESRKRPDIKIVSKSELILVENKIGSSGSAKQLENYAKILDSERGDRKPYLLYITKMPEPTPISEKKLLEHCEGLRFEHWRWREVFAVLEPYLGDKPDTQTTATELKKFMEEKRMSKKLKLTKASSDALNHFDELEVYSNILSDIYEKHEPRFKDICRKDGEIVTDAGTHDHNKKLKEIIEGKNFWISAWRTAGSNNFWFEVGFMDFGKQAKAYIHIGSETKLLQKQAEKLLAKESIWKKDEGEWKYAKSVASFVDKEDGVSELESFLWKGYNDALHVFNVLTDEEMQTVLEDLTPKFEKVFRKRNPDNPKDNSPHARFQDGDTYFGFWHDSTYDFCKGKEAFPHVLMTLWHTVPQKGKNKQAAEAFADKHKSKNWRLEGGKLWTGKSLADFIDEPDVVEAVKKWFEDRLKEAAKFKADNPDFGWSEDEA